MKNFLLALALCTSATTFAQDQSLIEPTMGRVFHIPGLKLDLTISPSRLGMLIGYVVNAQNLKLNADDFESKLNQSVRGVAYSNGFYPTQFHVKNAHTTQPILFMRGYTIQPVTQIREFHNFQISIGQIFQESRQ